MTNSVLASLGESLWEFVGVFVFFWHFFWPCKIEAKIYDMTCYYYHDTEMLSLSDLYMLATDRGGEAGALIQFLTGVREAMATHIKTECMGRCLGAHRHCENCTSREPVFGFDIATSSVCSRCQRVFHKACLRNKACPCYTTGEN